MKILIRKIQCLLGNHLWIDWSHDRERMSQEFWPTTVCLINPECANCGANKFNSLQEKTLEEEFKEYYFQKDQDLTYEGLLSFISSREEKAKQDLVKAQEAGEIPYYNMKIAEAREEGRKEKEKEYAEKGNQAVKTVITQYKEKLLGKLPEELVNTKEESNSDWFYGKGWNNALSEVKKLIKE